MNNLIDNEAVQFGLERTSYNKNYTNLTFIAENIILYNSK
jgi:hypothetical protein